MAQVVLKCSNNQTVDGGIENNELLEDTLVDLSKKFGEFCNSLSRELFQTGYKTSEVGTTANSYWAYHDMVNEQVFRVYAPMWLEYAKSNFSAFSEETFNAFENVIGRINSTRTNGNVHCSSESWVTEGVVGDIDGTVITAHCRLSEVDVTGNPLGAGWRGTTWFALVGSPSPTYNYEQITQVLNGVFNIKEARFVDAGLNSFNTGFMRGYNSGFLRRLGTEFCYNYTTQTTPSGD